MTKPDYCPVAQEPCQLMCVTSDVRCKIRDAAQPAVPDAFGTREGEHPQYIEGWNDCRAEMLKGMNT